MNYYSNATIIVILAVTMANIVSVEAGRERRGRLLGKNERTRKVKAKARRVKSDKKIKSDKSCVRSTSATYGMCYRLEYDLCKCNVLLTNVCTTDEDGPNCFDNFFFDLSNLLGESECFSANKDCIEAFERSEAGGKCFEQFENWEDVCNKSAQIVR